MESDPGFGAAPGGDELVEKVARGLARKAYSTGGMEGITDPYTPDADYWNALATAAIAVVLEEAAKVVRQMRHDPLTTHGDNHGKAGEWMRAALDDAEDAIRALMDKP